MQLKHPYSGVLVTVVLITQRHVYFINPRHKDGCIVISSLFNNNEWGIK